MLRSDQIMATVEMVHKENLDVRTVTMGINLLDCRVGSAQETCQAVETKIKKYAGNFVETCDEIAEKYGIPVVNKRISVTPAAMVGAGFAREEFVELAHSLDKAAKDVGVDILGGFTAHVEKGMTNTDQEFIEAIPEALAATERLCASINVGSSQKGINMDAVARLGKTVKELAEQTADSGGFGAAKFVVFCNQPGDNPFMAGAIHGVEEAEVVLNVGGPFPGRFDVRVPTLVLRRDVGHPLRQLKHILPSVVGLNDDPLPRLRHVVLEAHGVLQSERPAELRRVLDRLNGHRVAPVEAHQGGGAILPCEQLRRQQRP